jgi:hypothetical protein
MAYRIERRGLAWRLLYREDHGKAKKPTSRQIPKGSPEWQSFGLRPEMTLEDARAQIALYRAAKKIKDGEERKIRASHERVQRTEAQSIAWLPVDWVRHFEAEILPQYKIKPVAWKLAKRIIGEQKTAPWEWQWNMGPLWKPLVERALSEDYAFRVWSALRLYGRYYSHKSGQGKEFELLGMPTTALNLLKRAFHNKTGNKYKPSVMEEKHLATLKVHLREEHYNWMAIAFWFGLRPQEIKPVKWKILPDAKEPTRFPWALHVQQGKLEAQAIDPLLQWKGIPALLPEQVALRGVIESGKFKRPSESLLNSIKVHLGESRFQLKSARRGFVPLMLRKGYSRKQANRWLGHIDPELSVLKKSYDDPFWVEV